MLAGAMSQLRQLISNVYPVGDVMDCDNDIWNAKRKKLENTVKKDCADLLDHVAYSGVNPVMLEFEVDDDYEVILKRKDFDWKEWCSG